MSAQLIQLFGIKSCGIVLFGEFCLKMGLEVPPCRLFQYTTQVPPSFRRSCRTMCVAYPFRLGSL